MGNICSRFLNGRQTDTPDSMFWMMTIARGIVGFGVGGQCTLYSLGISIAYCL